MRSSSHWAIATPDESLRRSLCSLPALGATSVMDAAIAEASMHLRDLDDLGVDFHPEVTH